VRTVTGWSLLIAVALVVLPGAASAKPDIPLESLSADAPDDVRQQVERLYSRRSAERGQAAFLLGKMGEGAAPAIPFLIAMFGDFVQLEPGFSSQRTTPSEEAARALIGIGEPALAPLIAALDHERLEVRQEALI
jgi:HEAT repeat protein